MIGGSRDRLRARFAEQFAPAATGWIYRRGGRGPALPVGDADHAELVAGFDRMLRWTPWVGIPAAALIWGLLEWRDLHPLRWAVMVPFVLIFGGVLWWAWLAPARLLEGRAPVAPPLAGPEVRRTNLRKLPWRLLVLGMLVSIGLVVRVQFEPDPWSPHNRQYYAWAALFLLCFAALAIAKRRAG